MDIKWQSEVDEPAARPPMFTTSRIVVLSNRAIYGFDIETGKRHWKRNLSLLPTLIPINATDNMIIYGGQDGQVTAIQAETGKELWQHRLGNRPYNNYDVTSILIDNEDTIYITSQPTAVEALDLQTGQVRWSMTDSAKYNIPGRGARLFLENNQLYLVTTEVHVIDPVSGEVKQAIQENILGVAQLFNGKFYGPNWVRDADTFLLTSRIESPSEREFYDGCSRFEPPYIFSGRLFFALGRCGGVYALDIEDNEIQWKYRSDLIGQSPMTIYREHLYVLFENGEIHIVDPQTGEGQVAIKTGQSLPRTRAVGVVANQNILVTTFGEKAVWAFYK